MKNRVLVESLESKDAGKRNCVNIKHVVRDTENIMIGGIVIVKFNSRRCKVKVIDLLSWAKKRHAKMKKPTDSAAVKPVSHRGKKVSSDAVKKARCVRTK